MLPFGNLVPPHFYCVNRDNQMNTKSPTLKAPIRLTPRASALFDSFTPKAPAPTEVVAAKEKTAVKARLESTEEGVCPYCRDKMRHSTAVGLPVWLCEKDRHVVPLRNASAD